MIEDVFETRGRRTGSTERADADLRGHMHREKGLTADNDAREFLRGRRVKHVGTVDAAKRSEGLCR
jgi:hypothetical protein